MDSPDTRFTFRAVVRFQDVGLVQNGECLLDGVNMELAPGEIHALVGGTNAEKSALCSIAAGEIAPTSGMVSVNGRPLRVKTRRRMLAAGLIKVPKSPQLFPHLSVAQNLVAGYTGGWWSNWRPWKNEHRKVREWLERHDIRLPARTPLSFVPREDWLFIQILNLLYRRPGVFILDETLELLPVDKRAKIWPILLEQTGEGMTALWATQSIDDAFTYTNRVSVMHERRLLFTSETDNLDRLSLARLCYRRMLRNEDTTLEQFHQMLCITEAALRDLPTAVFVVDTAGKVRFANRSACEFFKVREKSLANADLGEAVGAGSEIVGLIRVAIAEAEEAGTDVQWHNQPYAAERKNRLADIRIRPIDEGGQRLGYMVVIEDVSLREDLRRQLALSENLASVGLLAAGVAHEVNNPLAIISNYNRYLRGKVDGDGPREAVMKIESQVRIIQEIVGSLTSFSAGAADGRRTVDLPVLGQELCRLVRADPRSKNLDIRCRGSSDALVVAEPNEMRLVILNLLRNAVDALVGTRGAIDVHFSREEGDGRRVVMTVTDTGPGISLADPNQVFLPFVSTKSTSGLNQGIGLSIAHRIVGKYLGEIRVENLERGGCRFTVFLPAAPDGRAEPF